MTDFRIRVKIDTKTGVIDIGDQEFADYVFDALWEHAKNYGLPLPEMETREWVSRSRDPSA